MLSVRLHRRAVGLWSALVVVQLGQAVHAQEAPLPPLDKPPAVATTNDPAPPLPTPLAAQPVSQPTPAPVP
ncbi:MAG: hypothetical protein JNM18_01975, partial [Planctomycetaceae bacterium]|nr:hypothetical protein [Planctomycetaceae bacterium]